MRVHADRARSGPAYALALLGLGCVYGGGLGTGPDPPREAVPAVAAQPLELSRRVQGAVDCAAGHCVRRYEIALTSHGELSIDVLPRLESTGDSIRVLLEDPAGNVIGRATSREPGRSLSVGGPDQPGRYSLTIQSASGSTSYVLRASQDRRGAPQTTLLEDDVARMKPATGRPQVPGTAAVAQPPPAPSGPSFRSNPQIDFAPYRSYAFAQDPERTLQAEPGAYVGNPFIIREIQRAIRYLLADRGYVQTAIEQAEFLVSTHTGSSSMAYYRIGGVAYNRTYSTWFNTWHGDRGFGVGGFRSEIHTEGTLVIDIIDLASKDLVWHGWTTKTTGWKDNEAVIKDAVEEILAQFPGS